MDLTVRDLFTALGMLFMGTGVYVALDRRVTRMEAIEHRVETIEKAFAAMQETATDAGKDIARMAAEMEAMGQRILTLEGTVTTGIGQVLTELRAQRPGA